MDNRTNAEGKVSAFTQVLSYQINDEDKKKRYDAYTVPLRWFVKLYTRKTHKISMADIAEKMEIHQTILSKMLSTDDEKDRRPITEKDINSICEIIGVPLSSILFLYEKKDYIEKNFRGDAFDRLTKLLAGNFDEILYPSVLSDVGQKEKLSKTKTIPSDNIVLDPLKGKWYFYFSSSDSEIVKNRKKSIKKPADFVPEEPELRELYDLYSPDHIYSGTITIEPVKGEYHAVLQYMTNPELQTVLQYEGIVSAPVDNCSIFSSLKNKKDGDTLYLIMSKPSHEKTLKYMVASVLTRSRHRDEERRRPCVLRMIFSRKPFEFDSKAYKVLRSELMMNDSVIRIDEEGYNELKNFQKDYDSPALDCFLEEYPDLESFSQDKHPRTVNRCAYIDEGFIRTFKDNTLTKTDIIYLEALLRWHSLAPWYSKPKAEKVNKNLKRFTE